MAKMARSPPTSGASISVARVRVAGETRRSLPRASDARNEMPASMTSGRMSTDEVKVGVGIEMGSDSVVGSGMVWGMTANPTAM